MIHLFEALGRKMALDVGSGAVMSLDDIRRISQIVELHKRQEFFSHGE